MELGLILGAVIFSIIIAGIGGGVAYWFWIKTRKKKQTWSAKVYQLGDGIKTIQTDNKGNIISNIELRDLKPYALDILEQVDKEPGITVYRLQKLNRTTPEVSSGYVDYWSKEQKEVSVLFHEGNFTLMKKGYDAKLGEFIFQPMPMSRINMMKSEMAIRKDRFDKEKDILQAISPWIVGGMALLTVVALFYIGIQGMIQISENLKEAAIGVSEVIDPPQPNSPQDGGYNIQALGSPPLVEGG